MAQENPNFISANDDDLLEYDARSIASYDSEITVDSEVARKELEEFLLAREKPQDILDRIRELNAQALASGGASGSDKINVYTINLNALNGDSKVLGTITEDVENVAPSSVGSVRAIEGAPQHPKPFLRNKSLLLLISSIIIIIVTLSGAVYFLKKSPDTAGDADDAATSMGKGKPPAKSCYNFKDHADKRRGEIVQRSAWLTSEDQEELKTKQLLSTFDRMIIKFTPLKENFCHPAELNENFILYGDAIFEVRGFTFSGGRIRDTVGTDFGGAKTIFINILAWSNADDLKKKFKLLKTKLIDSRSTTTSAKNITIYDFDKIEQRESDETWSEAFENFKAEMQSGAVVFPTLPSIITHMVVDARHDVHHYQVQTRSTIQLIYMDLYKCTNRPDCEEEEIKSLRSFYDFVFYENWIYQTKPLDCGARENGTVVERCESYSFLVTKKYSEDIKRNLVQVVRMLIDFGKLSLSKYEYALIAAESKKFYGSEFYVEDLEDDVERAGRRR